jgi:hypothetical protein
VKNLLKIRYSSFLKEEDACRRFLFCFSCRGELGYVSGIVLSDYIPVLQAGALLPYSHGLPNKYDGDITFIGHVMAKLPVDTCIAKLILLGNIFSVLEECIIMGKCMGYTFKLYKLYCSLCAVILIYLVNLYTEFMYLFIEWFVFSLREPVPVEHKSLDLKNCQK